METAGRQMQGAAEKKARRVRQRQPEISWTFAARIEPGEYPAYCRSVSIYRDGQFKRWVCAVQFDALDTRPAYYLFPFGKPTPNDPTRPITDVTSAWEALRKRAGVQCRLHDLRHTAATKMAEAGVPESTMLALMGHVSRAMMERYSHIRMTAKREAVEAMTIRKPETNSEAVPTKSTTVGRVGHNSVIFK
jgi:integrase